MSRLFSIRTSSPTNDRNLESISLRSVDQLSVREQQSDIGPSSDHSTYSYSPDSDETRFLGLFRHPWIAQRRPYLQNRQNAWKSAMIFNMLMTLGILLFNASFFAIAAGHHDYSEGSLYTGSCQKTEMFAMLSHIVINIFGTLLLSASNYTMQILTSPSRDDINSAHGHDIALSIGVQSPRNLKFVGYTRLTIWIALAIASIPLHLLYNSAVFTTNRQSAYLVAVVTSEFAHGAHFDLQLTNQLSANAPIPDPEIWGYLFKSYSGQTPDAMSELFESIGYQPPQVQAKDQDVLASLQRKVQHGGLVNMTNEECYDLYRRSSPGSYRHILAISSDTTSNNSVLWLDKSSSPDKSSNNWVCAYRRVLNMGCADFSDYEVWPLGLYAKHKGTMWELKGYPISRCLVELGEDPCLLRYNSSILIIILIANAVKLVAMLATMFQYRQPALVTVGDAVASFLETPDYTTYKMCLPGKDRFNSNTWTIGPQPYSVATTESQRSTGASQLQWAATAALLVCCFIGGAVCVILVYDNRVGLDWVLGGPAEPDSAELGQGLPESVLICFANIPQLVLSFNYILCNRLMTCMAGAREWSMFAHKKKGLRTSQPRGSQRSTYWLQLPMRFSLPMMGVSTLLHYVTSQTIHFGSRKYFDYPGADGKLIILEDKSGLGYSQTAIHVLLILLILAFAAIVTWGQRHNQLGIPPCGFNSAAISAACHPPAEEEEPHLKPVQWGVVANDGDQDEIGHCSFSSGEVSMPIVGRMYM